MRAYLAILSARFRTLLQYRAAALAGMSTQLFWGLIRVMIFTAFYHSSTGPQPLTLQETINYIWLSQALLLILPWNLDQEIAEKIRAGNVAYELARPLDLYWFWFCRSLALRLAPLTLRAIPIFLFACGILNLELPHSWTATFLFLASLLIGLVLSSAITALLSISLFWTLAGEGMVRILSFASVFLSGLVIPLPLFPDWSQPVLARLPFRGLIDLPFRFYMGNYGLRDAPALFASQLLWCVILILVGRVLMRRGQTRVVVQGG